MPNEYNADVTAEFGFGLLLAIARNMHLGKNYNLLIT